MEKTRDEIAERPEFEAGMRGDGPVRGPDGHITPPRNVAPTGIATATHVGAPEVFHWRDFDPASLQGSVKDLAKEMTTYRDRLDELLAHEGQYVLIRGDQVVGYYPDQASALSVAVANFGQRPI